jgi:hypothetical protein
MRRTKKEVYLAVLALELLELAADVLSRLLCRGGHRRRPSGGRKGLGLAARRVAHWGRRLGFGYPSLEMTNRVITLSYHDGKIAPFVTNEHEARETNCNLLFGLDSSPDTEQFYPASGLVLGPSN